MNHYLSIALAGLCFGVSTWGLLDSFHDLMVRPRPGKYYRWFAWRPIKCSDGRRRWMTHLYICGVYDGSDISTWFDDKVRPNFVLTKRAFVAWNLQGRPTPDGEYLRGALQNIRSAFVGPFTWP